MANSKISALTAATTPVAGTETLPIVQSGATKQVSIANLTAGRSVSMAGATITGASTSIDFTGTTQRMTADTTGATINDRFAFVTSQSNTTTRFNVAPSGTGIASSINVFQANNLNNTSVGALIINPTAVTLSSGITGTGTYLPLFISVGGATQAQIDTSGNLTLNTGNLIQGTAAKGVNFTANTPAAGMTSQLLNWYEEGTWTPGVAFNGGATGITYSSQSGTYTRIGRQVTCAFEIVLSSKGSSTGRLNFTGLPFTSSGGARSGGALTYFTGVAGTYNPTFYVNSGSTTTDMNPADLGVGISDSNCTNTSTFIGYFTYFV